MKVAKEQIDTISGKLSTIHDNLNKKGTSEKKIEYIQELLNKVDLLKEMDPVTTNNNVIGIGSKFNARVETDYGVKDEDYILSESDEPVDGYVIILPNYPIAKALTGKTVNDTVEFDVNSYKVVATVNEIYKEKIITKTIR